MRIRIKIWSDTSEVELNPTWMRTKAYSDLPIADAEHLNEFVEARAAFDRARAKFISTLHPPEPLDEEELALLKKDEVIA